LDRWKTELRAEIAGGIAEVARVAFARGLRPGRRDRWVDNTPPWTPGARHHCGTNWTITVDAFGESDVGSLFSGVRCVNCLGFTVR
jgi:hypothetical protein